LMILSLLVIHLLQWNTSYILYISNSPLKILINFPFLSRAIIIPIESTSPMPQNYWNRFQSHISLSIGNSKASPFPKLVYLRFSLQLSYFTSLDWPGLSQSQP
jgi:hypothetical protein